MAKKFITFLILLACFQSFYARADIRSVSLKNLQVEITPTSGKLTLRDRKTRRSIFVGCNFSEQQLKDVYHKYSLGRSIEALGVADVKFQIDDEQLKSQTNPQLGLKVQAAQAKNGTIKLPAQEVNPWIQSNGDGEVARIKVDREIILSKPIVGDAEADDFLEFVNGVNAKRGSGKSTIKFDLDRFNNAPSNYWEILEVKKDK
jgi:hypothetical protein